MEPRCRKIAPCSRAPSFTWCLQEENTQRNQGKETQLLTTRRGFTPSQSQNTSTLAGSHAVPILKNNWADNFELILANETFYTWPKGMPAVPIGPKEAFLEWGLFWQLFKISDGQQLWRREVHELAQQYPPNQPHVTQSVAREDPLWCSQTVGRECWWQNSRAFTSVPANALLEVLLKGTSSSCEKHCLQERSMHHCSGVCISYFFVPVIKYHDQKRLTQERVCFGLLFRRIKCLSGWETARVGN